MLNTSPGKAWMQSSKETTGKLSKYLRHELNSGGKSKGIFFL
jgi:hypothetical protein